MIDESGAKYVEEDIVRWLTVLWCKNIQKAAEDGMVVPPAIREARERIDAAMQIGGVPDGYRRSSDERKGQLLKSAIILPGGTEVAGTSCQVYSVEGTGGQWPPPRYGEPEPSKPKRATEAAIDGVAYMDDRRKKRLKSLIKYKKL